jgi:hypothetical protein
LALNNNSGKVYAVTPVIQDDGAMPYAIDHKEGDLTLADFVKRVSMYWIMIKDFL